MDIAALDPLSVEWRRDPYPCYRALREHAPVQRSASMGAWCVSRYDDVMFVLRSPEIFSSRAMFTFLMNGGNEGRPPLNWPLLRFLARFAWRVRMNPFALGAARNLIAEDGESHTTMRAIVNRGFTPRRISDWEERARALVATAMQKVRSGGAFDLVQDVAVPLPVTLIAEMLGVERERLRDFKHWSDEVIHGATGPGRSNPFAPRHADAMTELLRYVKRIAEERQRAPSDDLVSLIVGRQQDGSALSIREVVLFIVLLLVAGNETTTNLIGNAVTALLDHPSELARLARDPSLAPGAIEETLRFDSPIQVVLRTATQEVEIAGTRIPKGAYVAPLLGSANRDERRFPDPDRFDITRNPQGHVGFGFGKHFCLGASLARLEARVALEALAPELLRLERHGPSESVESFLVRGLKRLDLRPAA